MKKELTILTTFSIAIILALYLQCSHLYSSISFKSSFHLGNSGMYCSLGLFTEIQITDFFKSLFLGS